tara:strand:- start:314 stop:793 length:480 start_codon:yes stop_codon:yes gene_type:complete
MKKDIHPGNYRLVAFKDMSNNDVFITKSAVETKDTINHEGVDYPLVKLEISRTSHPYYTGKTKLVDTAGRIDKFKNRYAGLSLKKSDESKSSAEVAPVEESSAEAAPVEKSAAEVAPVEESAAEVAPVEDVVSDDVSHEENKVDKSPKSDDNAESNSVK